MAVALQKSHNNSAIHALFRAHGQARRVSKREFLLPHAEEVKSIFIVTKGAFSFDLSSDCGDEAVHLCFLRPGDIFGEQPVLGAGQGSLTTGTYSARCDSEVLSIPVEQFTKFAEANPKLVVELSLMINQRLAVAANKLAQFVFLDSESRCYECLVDMAYLPDAMSHPDGIQVRLSRKDLASMVRCSRETAGRALKDLSQQQRISVKGQTIVLFGLHQPSLPPRVGFHAASL